MYLVNSWLIVSLVGANLILSLILIIKMVKQEKFFTNEAQTNLQLINQSLNRLSDITESLESKKTSEKQSAQPVREALQNDSSQGRERQALTLIRGGEDPVSVSRKLSISRSEIDLMVASEKLGKKQNADSHEIHS